MFCLCYTGSTMENSLETICPECGLTLSRLRDQGRMGCAACYAVFETVVIQAAAELHGVTGDKDKTTSVPTRPPLPWPTRQAESHPPPPPLLLEVTEDPASR